MGIPQLVDRAWEGLPRPVKDGAKSAWAGYARLTSGSRLLPDHLIIGTQRAGTTSLYKYLVKHPAIAHALTKELRFFDLHYDRGFGWYRSRFPSVRHRERLRRAKGLSMIVGESSPDYLFHPYAPARIARDLPNAKLVVLLRNPVDRADSPYWPPPARGVDSLGRHGPCGRAAPGRALPPPHRAARGPAGPGPRLGRLSGARYGAATGEGSSVSLGASPKQDESHPTTVSIVSRWVSRDSKPESD